MKDRETLIGRLVQTIAHAKEDASLFLPNALFNQAIRSRALASVLAALTNSVISVKIARHTLRGRDKDHLHSLLSGSFLAKSLVRLHIPLDEFTVLAGFFSPPILKRTFRSLCLSNWRADHRPEADHLLRIISSLPNFAFDADYYLLALHGDCSELLFSFTSSYTDCITDLIRK